MICVCELWLDSFMLSHFLQRNDIQTIPKPSLWGGLTIRGDVLRHQPYGCERFQNPANNACSRTCGQITWAKATGNLFALACTSNIGYGMAVMRAWFMSPVCDQPENGDNTPAVRSRFPTAAQGFELRISQPHCSMYSCLCSCQIDCFWGLRVAWSPPRPFFH